MHVFLLNLAAVLDSYIWLLLTLVLKTEGVFTMLCVHVFLFC